MTRMLRYVVVFCVATVVEVSTATATDITSAQTGAWSATSTWTGGVVPTAADNVEIVAGHTVTIDVANAACNNLIANGYLYFDIVNTGFRLTVNGDATVGAAGRLRSGSGTPTAARAHELILRKNLTVLSGGSFDMRVGTGATVSVGRVIFSGSTNSTINLSLTTYSSSVEEFNSVIIEKTGGARVILASGYLYQNNNSTNSPDTLVLNSGVVETGNNHWVILRTSPGAIVGASQASYIRGFIGRGITNSGTTTAMDFPVGDSLNYRPLNLRIVGPANATGHYVWATLRRGNANTGSSTFSGGIDRVSAVRYYEVGYLKNAGSADTMKFYGFGPSYGTDDGVAASNTHLRVAYSTNARATWINHGPANHTTSLTNPPTTILGDSLSPTIGVFTGTSMFVALARQTGTTTNTLGGPTSVVEGGAVPHSFYVAGNYPNPFNPATTIEYGLPRDVQVEIKIFSLLGQELTTLVNERQVAGVHRVQFEASKLPSGTYIYHINAGGEVKSNRMMLVK